MQNFIVLGYIPYTHIQITFREWLIAVGCCCVAYLLLGYCRKAGGYRVLYRRLSEGFDHWLSQPVITSQAN